MSVLNKHPQTKIQNFSVETVRNILKIDNKGIAQLCAKVSLMPKKDIQGRTYFTRDDVEILRRIKTISDKQKTMKRAAAPATKAGKSYVTVPMKKVSAASAAAKDTKNAQPKAEPKVPQAVENQISPATAVVDRLCNSLVSLENNLVSKLSKLVDEKVGSKLDEKLDGMDEIVVELIRCKTENEKLRQKVDDLTKENYRIKATASTYRPIAFGLYVKDTDERLF